MGVLLGSPLSRQEGFVAQLAVHARFTAKSGRGEELLKAVLAMFPTAADEAGTLVYAAHRDRDDDDAVVMYELYRDDAALEDHGASEAASRFGKELDTLLGEEPEVWFTRPVGALGLEHLPEG